MVAAPPAEGFFLEVSGLPLHPLVVHAAVVLLPLATLGLIAIVLVPRWRRPFGWVVMAGLLLGAGAAFVAKESGEALADVVGNPVEHARWGDILPPVAVLLLLVAAVWFWLWRRDDAAQGRTSLVTTVTGIVSVVLGVVVLGLTFLVGHSGAEAVWGGRLAAATTPTTGASPTAAPSASSTASAGASVPAGSYTLADVQQHATPSDCWSVVSGQVYDLTAWIGQHPGGAGVIEGMCGRDATAAFDGQHQGQQRPADELSRFLKGPLATASAAAGASATGAAPSGSSSAAASGAGGQTYTLAEVAKHGSASDCWSVVGKDVYDLTAWIDQHPGGPGVIEGMCGQDGTAAYNGQHEGQRDPAQALADFRIGTLA